MLNPASHNVVQIRVGRQRILIGLIWAQLGAGRLVDAGFWNGRTRETKLRKIDIDPI